MHNSDIIYIYVGLIKGANIRLMKGIHTRVYNSALHLLNENLQIINEKNRKQIIKIDERDDFWRVMKTRSLIPAILFTKS